MPQKLYVPLAAPLISWRIRAWICSFVMCIWASTTHFLWHSSKGDVGDAGSSDVGGGIGDEGDVGDGEVGDGEVGDGNGVVMSTLRSPLPCNRKISKIRHSQADRKKCERKGETAVGGSRDRHHGALQQGERISTSATGQISNMMLPLGPGWGRRNVDCSK